LIKEEVERRGYVMPCGERKEDTQANGAGRSNEDGAAQNGGQTEEEDGVYL
jgi:hypothetical protein